MQPDRAAAGPQTESSDEELLRRIVGGDRIAFEQLYFRLYNPLYQFVGRMTRHIDVSEDVLNETMLTVWQKAADFHGESKVSTWVFGIAYRKALKALERNRRWEKQVSAQSNAEIETYVTVEPDESLMHAQLQQRVQTGLKSLNTEQRTAFELTFYFGYSYPEIARICGCSVNTVKTRMFHARRRLQPYLEPKS